MKTAFSSFVFGAYEKFIPFYVLAIQKNYPQSDIVVFYDRRLSPATKKLLSYKKLTVVENMHQNSHYFKDFKIPGGGFKFLRWLLPHSYFEGYDYVYFGDIDILVLEEPQSLFDFHKDQMEQLKLPFSNKVRLTKNGELSKRLTGLHCVQVSEYFKQINPIITKILSNEQEAIAFVASLKRDEELLYKMNKEAFSFDPLSLSKALRPWHGFHLGLVRGKDYLNTKAIAENSNLDVSEIRNQLDAFLTNATFRKTLQKVYCPELYYTLRYFNVTLPKNLVFKYQMTTFMRSQQKLLHKGIKKITKTFNR